MPGEPSEKEKTTTMQVDREVKKFFDKVRKGDESNNSIIHRLMARQMDVFLSFILIDNELPLGHTVVFQLGEDPLALYHFDGDVSTLQDFATPITAEEVQNILKQPKPHMTVTFEEAVDILALAPNCKASDRIRDFLENAGEPSNESKRTGKKEFPKGTTGSV